MDNINDLLEYMDNTLSQLSMLFDTAYIQYAQEVDAFLTGNTPSEREIEHLLDGLMSFCSDDRFVALFKRVCRHTFDRHPQLIADYILMFRSYYDEKEAIESDLCDV